MLYPTSRLFHHIYSKAGLERHGSLLNEIMSCARRFNSSCGPSHSYLFALKATRSWEVLGCHPLACR